VHSQNQVHTLIAKNKVCFTRTEKTMHLCVNIQLDIVMW